MGLSGSPPARAKEEVADRCPGDRQLISVTQVEQDLEIPAALAGALSGVGERNRDAGVTPPPGELQVGRQDHRGAPSARVASPAAGGAIDARAQPQAQRRAPDEPANAVAR